LVSYRHFLDKGISLRSWPSLHIPLKLRRRPPRPVLSFSIDRPRIVYRRKLDNRQELLDELRQVIAYPLDVLYRRMVAPRRKQYTRTYNGRGSLYSYTYHARHRTSMSTPALYYLRFLVRLKIINPADVYD